MKTAASTSTQYANKMTEALARSFGPIEVSAVIEHKAQINCSADDATIEQYSVWQLQQLRRVARCLGHMPWRHNRMRADYLLEITRRLLTERGAMAVAR